MSAHLQTALRHRFAVPAWWLAVAVAMAIAIAVGAAVLLDGSRERFTPPAAADAAPARSTSTPPLQHETACVDSRTVGHC